MNKKYRDLVKHILDEGYTYEDPNRKGVLRKQVSHYTLKHNIQEEGFPFITSKRTYPMLALKELELFLSGETDIRKYWEIGVNFWDHDWLRYIGEDKKRLDLEDSKYQLPNIYPDFLTKWGGNINQVEWLLDVLESNPMATKKTITMWDPGKKGVLSPCHFMVQALVRPLTREERLELYLEETNEEFYVGGLEDFDIPEYALTVKWHQHSVDVGLGILLNVAYYGGMCTWLAAMTNMVPEGIIGDLSNVHIYDNAIEASKDLLKQPIEQEKVEVLYKITSDTLLDEYPKHQNFIWDKTKVKMGKRYDIPMLTYNK